MAWIEQLPADLRQSRPVLCINHAWALLGTRQIAEAEVVLQLVEAYQHLAPESPIAAYLKTIRSFLAIGQGDLMQAAQLAQSALDEMTQITKSSDRATEEASILTYQSAATRMFNNGQKRQGMLRLAYYRPKISICGWASLPINGMS